MSDGEHNDGPAPESPYVWQSLDRLSQLLGLSQKEVVDQIGRGVERLRIGGNTLLRVAENLPDEIPEERSADAEIQEESRSHALDAQWETVLQEYRDGLHERPHQLAPRAPENTRQEIEQEAAREVSDASSPQHLLHSWSRFPGWFGPLFEPDEVPVR